MGHGGLLVPWGVPSVLCYFASCWGWGWPWVAGGLVWGFAALCIGVLALVSCGRRCALHLSMVAGEPQGIASPNLCLSHILTPLSVRSLVQSS